APSRVGAGDRLVVAVGQWGIETPFAWRSSQSEKTLWDCMHDPLIMRDPKTFAYVPGLATEWKPSNELRTWTFKLRSGVQFHDGFGEMTAEDVKFTVEQNLRPDVPAGSAPFFRLYLRRIPDPATRLAGLRSGEIDIGNVFGDYLDQARKAGLRIHEAQNAACHWVVLQGQTTPDREDYCPACPWAGDPKDPKSQDNARKVRLALNLAVNKKTIVNALWKGMGSDSPFMYWYYPFHKGFSKDWKVPPYDPERAKKLLAEAGHAGGFEVRVNPLVMTYALDGPDMVEA